MSRQSVCRGLKISPQVFKPYRTQNNAPLASLTIGSLGTVNPVAPHRSSYTLANLRLVRQQVRLVANRKVPFAHSRRTGRGDGHCLNSQPSGMSFRFHVFAVRDRAAERTGRVPRFRSRFGIKAQPLLRGRLY